jgi:hypothetical protein
VRADLIVSPVPRGGPGYHAPVQPVGRFHARPNQITQRKTELLQCAADVSATVARKRKHGPGVRTLHAKLAQSALENDVVSGALGRIGDASATR